LSACSAPELQQDGGDLTRSEVEFLSGRLSAAVEAEYPVLQHKLVNRYVNTLGQSIVSRNPDMPPLAYEFRVLKTNEVFAFSLPGGIVYISLGTLRAMKLEGELAGALSHELAHQQLGHSLVIWRRKVNANRRQRYLLDFSGPWKAHFLGPEGALQLEKGMEEEADRLAPVILYRSGFDPRLYTSYLEVLRKIEVSDPARVANLMSLHPSIKEREAWVKESLAKLPPLKDPSVSSATFQQIKDILQEAAKRGGKALDQ
jgi:predicted Zn-dependent protease